MKSGRKKIVLWILVAWVVLMLALSPQFIAAHRENQKLESTFEEFVGFLEKQQFEMAYQQCGTDFRKTTSFDQFAAFYKNLNEQYGKLDSANHTSYEMHASGNPFDWRAIVTAEFDYANKDVKFRFSFHKQDDRWVLFGTEQL